MSIISETNQQQLLNQSTHDGSGLCATSRDYTLHNINNLYTIFTIIDTVDIEVEKKITTNHCLI